MKAGRVFRSPNDVLFGAFVIAAALLAFYLSRNLRLGTAVRMGPGYIPQLLCWVQLGLGVAILGQGLLVHGERLEAWSLRPLVMVLASVAFFGVAIERFGLVVAVIGLVILAILAQPKAKPTESLLLAALLAVFAVLVFVKGLGLPLAIWPPALVLS